MLIVAQLSVNTGAIIHRNIQQNQLGNRMASFTSPNISMIRLNGLYWVLQCLVGAHTFPLLIFQQKIFYFIFLHFL